MEAIHTVNKECPGEVEAPHHRAEGVVRGARLNRSLNRFDLRVSL